VYARLAEENLKRQEKPQPKNLFQKKGKNGAKNPEYVGLKERLVRSQERKGKQL